MAEPPAGAVTFLLTDIEGSVRLWQRDQEAMSAALARHDEILRRLIVQHGGHVVKGAGDGIWAVFEQPAAALDAALAIQAAIRRTAWGEIGELRVRIAVHTGDAERRDGDYFGPTLNRLARLIELARGGQILASETTLRLAGPGVAGRASVSSLGPVRLRGLDEPLGVFEIAPGGPAEGLAPDRADRASSGPPAEATIRVYMLGGFRVETPAGTVGADRWARRAGRQLFKCLLTRRTRRLPREEAYALFWPRSDPEAAASTIRSTIHALRRILEPDVDADASVIVLDRDTVGIRREAALWVDADEFERIATEARRADVPDDRLEVADRLYVGDYLPDDQYDDWASQRREALRVLWAGLQLELSRRRERRGEVDRAVSALQRLQAADSCDERAARELMLLLDRHGRRAEALRVYQRLVQALRDELEAEPSDETVQVQRRIARSSARPATGGPGVAPGLPRTPRPRGDEPLTPRPPLPHAGEGEPGGMSWGTPRLPGQNPVPSTGLPLSRVRERGAGGEGFVSPGAGGAGQTRGESRSSSPGPAVVPSPPFLPSYPFPTPGELVGRDAELELLASVLERGRTGGQVALIGGPAGAGKSALVGALVRQAQGAGVLCLAGGAYEQESVIPLGPTRDALADYLLTQPAEDVRDLLGDSAADLTLVVPELAYHLRLPERADAEPGRDLGRLFGAVFVCLRGLAERQPILFCLEDLHAADGGTLALLQFLARRARRLPLVLLGTYRIEEALPGQELARMLAALAREGAQRISLAPLDRDQTGRLIATLLDGPASQQLGDSLYAATEGNPLFLEQSILALREEGHIDRHGSVWRGADDRRLALPTVVREVLNRRLSRLSERCHGTVAMAAVLGRTVEYEVLVAALAPRPELSVVEDVEEALRAQVLQEMPSGYAFTHALLRDAVYWSLSAPRRMLLHGHAGTALERLAGPRVAERAPALAYHFVLDGHADEVREKALRYSREAGRRAAVLSLHREALEHFTRACELIDHEGVAVEPEAHLDILEGRATAERALGLWLPLVETCERVLALTHDPLRRARARGSIGHARQRTGDTARAVRECDGALAELERAPAGPDVAAARLQLLTDKAYLLFLQGRYGEQARLGAEMLPAALQLGQPRPIEWAHNALALAAMGQGQVDRALEHFEQLRIVAARSNDLLTQALAHSNLGIQHQFAGDFARARADLERAIELCREAGAEHRAINTIQRLGWVMLGEGDLRAALQHAEDARELASRAADRWLADCHDLLGTIHALRADWPAATEAFDAALRLRERGPHVVGRVETLLGLGLVHQHRGDWPAARDRFAGALETAASIDPSPWLVAARRQLGRLLWLLGDEAGPDLVRASLALAETMPRSIEYGPTVLVAVETGALTDDPLAALERALAAGLTAEVRIEVHCALACLQSASGAAEVAQSHLLAAQGIADRLEAPRLGCLVHRTAGALAAAAGERARAASSYEQAVRLARAATLPYEEAQALTAYASVSGLDPARATAELQVSGSRLQVGDAPNLKPEP